MDHYPSASQGRREKGESDSAAIFLNRFLRVVAIGDE